MMKELLDGVDVYLTRHRRKKIEKGFVRVMALVVACSIVYALMLPAITMETKTYCALQEHQHKESCYSDRLICQLPESPEGGHIHDETCYERTLICAKEEHTHTLICYSNPNADVETAADWEQTIPDDLSGDWAKDLIAVAKSQIDYSESESNYTVDETGAMQGYTRYGAWYGDPYGDWSAMFVSFCLNYAQIPEDSFPGEADCAAWVDSLSELSLYRSCSDYEPAAGDVAFFDTDGDKTVDRAGLVAELLNAEDNAVRQLKTIEGDVNGRVTNVTYPLTDERIVGYAQLPVNPDAPPVDPTPATTDPAETIPSETDPAETIPPETVTEETLPADVPTGRPIIVSGNGEAGLYASDPNLFGGHEYLEIRNNQMVSVNIASGGINYFRFTPTITHTYSFSGNADKYAYVYLYDSTGTSIRNVYSYGYSFNLTYTLRAGETYYFGVKYSSSSDSGSFRATLTYGAHGNSPFGEDGICDCGATASNIAVGIPESVNITEANGWQFFRFQPTVTHGYVFESTGSSDTYAYLYDAAGNQLASTSSGGSGSNFRLTYTLTAGEVYYFGAKLYSTTATGSFDVQLTYKPDAHSFSDGICGCGEEAYLLNLDDAADVNITTAGDYAYFYYVPALTHTYVFESAGACNTYGYLYDAAGNRLTYDSYGGSGNNFRLTYALTAGETYYFVVKLYDASATGSFTATLSVIHNYGMNQECDCGAVRPDLQVGDTVTVNFLSNGSYDYFRFTPTATHDYVFESIGNNSTGCYLYDADGNQLAFTRSGGSGNNFRLTYRLEAGKTYYFGARYYSGSTGSYSATLSYGAHKFSGDQCTCGVGATPIAQDTTLTVNIETPGEWAYYIFQPTVTHTYAFESYGNYNTYCILYNADGNQLASASSGGIGDNFKLTYAMTAGSTYYLWVKLNNAGITGSFKATFSGVHSYNENGECTCGVVKPDLQVGDTVTVNIPSAGGYNYFRFTPTVTHDYVFESNASADTYGYLYDADMRQLTIDDDGGSGHNFRITYRLEAGKTYYFGAGYYSNGTGSYSATISYGSHSYSDGKCACGTKSTPIVLDTPVTADVDTPGAWIYYSFTPTVTHDYVLEATGDCNSYGYLYNSSWSQITRAISNGGNFKLTYTLNANTTYYFGVCLTDASSTGSFDLSLTYGEERHSFTNDVCACGAVAHAIELDTTTPVKIETPGEWVYFNFTPTETHDYVLESTGECDTCAYLYTSGWSVCTSSSSGGSGKNFKLTYTLNANTTYYFGVRLSDVSSTGSFNVSLVYRTDSHRFDDEGKCACGAVSSAIALAVLTPVKIETPGDSVYYSFTPTETHDYVLESVGDCNTAVYLYSSSWSELQSTSYGGRGNNFKLTYTLYANTTYYFKIRLSDTGSTGEFNVVLNYSPYGHKFDAEGNCACSGEIPAIAVGDTDSVSISTLGGYKYYRFTPAVTHEYVLESTGDCDTCAYLCDSSGKRITYTYSNGKNLKLTRTLKADTTYYYVVGLRYPDDAGDFTVRLGYGTGGHAYAPEDGLCPCGASATVMELGKLLPVKRGTNRYEGTFCFTPQVTHTYVFQTSNSYYTYGHLYDSNWSYLTSTSSDSNLKLTYTLTAGKTYYWTTESSYSSAYSTTVTYGAHSYDDSGVCTGCGRREDSCGEDVTYTLEDGVLTIRGSGATDNFNSMYFRAPWYDVRDQITSVVVEDGVTGLGDYLFADCVNLQSVSIADSVESIGNYAFSHCTGLTSVTIPGSVKSIGNYAFRYCSGLTSVTIPGSVETIGDYAFSQSGLTSVTMQDGVGSIGNYAFYDCTGLTSVTIPGSVETIGNHAFNYCTGLKSVTMQDGVSSIGNYAFSHCTGLTSVTIPGSVETIGDDAFYYCTGLTSVTIPGNVKSLGSHIFEYCPALTYAEFAEGATTTGDYTFYNCNSLASVTLPSTLTAIGSNAFYRCTGLVTAEIPNGVTTIGERAFYDCSKLSHIVIPESVTTIGKEAFYNCKGLTSVIIPEGATCIEDYAFAGIGITSITIPDTVTRIGDYAFYNCKDLADITIPDSVISIGKYAFSGCTSLTSLEIPEAATDIGEYAFSGCTGLTSFRIPAGIPGIPTGMLDHCSGLTGITIPEGVTRIGGNAFYSCSGLTSVTIPEGVTSIGSGAFSFCRGLTGVTIPASVTSIGSCAFYSCSGLTGVTIPEGVKSIGNETFYSCEQLTSINLPGSLTSIDGAAFERCRQLISITIPEGVTSIGYSAFEDCDRLTSINLPDSLTSIGGGAFMSCDSLMSIVLPEGIKSIGDETFYGCSKLASISLPGSLTSIGSRAFRDCDSLISIVIPEGVTSIGNEAFEYCNGIRSITIPDSVTRIGNSAFSSCSNLGEIVLPKNLKDLGNSAFSSCGKVSSVRLNASNLDIGYSYWASGLSYVSSLTVGDSVDVLSANFMAQLSRASGYLQDIRFIGENYFTLADDLPTAWSLPLPVSRMTAGEYFVDESGVLYRLCEDNTAKLFYVPKGLDAYTVLAEIPSDDGAGPWTVTSVEAGSLRQASLTEITFAAPESILTIPADGLGSCPTLTSVNNCTTVETAAASFTNPAAQIDALAFFGSGLQGNGNPETENGDFIIEVPSVEGEQAILARITVSGEEGEKYAYLTGEKMTASLFVQGLNLLDPDYRYVRFYFSFDGGNHNMSMEPGEYTNDGYPYSIFETPVAGCYCVRVPIISEETFRMSIDSVYYDIISAGGSLRLWAVALTETEDQELGSGIRFAPTCRQVTWTVQPRSAPVTKELYKNNNNTEIVPKIMGDGTESNTVYLQNLRYSISINPDASGSTAMGKDLMQSIVFSDTLTLPEGIHLRDGLADAVRAGQYYTSYTYYSYGGNYYQLNVMLEGKAYPLAGVRVLSGSTGNLRQCDWEADIDDAGRLVFRWTVENKAANRGAKSLDIPKHSYEVFFGNQVLVVENSALTNTEPFSIHNAVAAEEFFTYSDSITETATCAHDVKVAAPDFTVKNSYVHMGEWGYGSGSNQNQNVHITLENPSSFSFEGIRTVHNSLSGYCYIPAGKMEKMIGLVRDGAVEGVDNLTFTITYATFCRNEEGAYTPGSQVVGANDRTYTLMHANTGVGTSYDGMETKDDGVLNKSVSANDRITILYDVSSDTTTLTYQYTDQGGSVVSGELDNVTDIGAALEGLGYFVTRFSDYSVDWNLREDYVLYSNEIAAFDLYFANKDSFMIMTRDMQERVSDYFYVSNTACAYFATKDSEDLSRRYAADYCWDYLWCEWSLNHSASSGGETLGSGSSAVLGSVIDYTISASRRYDGGVYDVVPLVEHLEGAQLLLAPVSKNQAALQNQGLEIYTAADGAEYYLLTVPAGETSHTYRGVTLSGRKTDSITVTQKPDGLDYLIRWYLTDFATGSDGVTATLRYQTLFDPDRLTLSQVSGTTLRMGSECWLNDHESHRLYDSLDIEGALILIDKSIVTEKGAAPEEDALTDWSVIHEEETVTYRVTLEAVKDNVAITITGADILDVLPETGGVFGWDADHVKVSYSGAEFGGSKDADAWTIATKDAKQCIDWDDDLTLTFTDSMYIYITATYPKGATWESYVERIRGERLEARFYLESQSDAAYHDLCVQTEAYLQKGVLSTSANSYGYWYRSNNVDSRLFYNNRDRYQRYVNYYVVLYNSGSTRLYLNPIQDVLPAGFTYYVYDGSNSSYRPTIYDVDGKVIAPVWKSFSVSADKPKTTAGGQQRLTFTLSNSERWDPLFEKYYLAPGEAVFFYYSCNTNAYAESEDLAVNTVAMPFYDYCGGGVRMADVNAVGGKSGDEDKTTKNDGKCELNATPWARNLGFEGGDMGTYWLASDVTMMRATIQPGISVGVESITQKVDGIEIKDPLYSGLQDTINWAVTAYSGGCAAIHDYTLTDVVQSPYCFTGTVKFSTNYGSYYNTSNVSGLSDVTLFTIGERTKDDPDAITLTYMNNGTSETTTIRRGEKLTFTHREYGQITVRIYVNGDGNEAISVRLHGDILAIPEGGSAKLRVSAVNVTGVYSHKDFYNSAYLTPEQPFDGSLVTKGHFTQLDGRDSVRSGSQIFVAYGHVVTYSQKIEELADSTNYAVSSDLDYNYILLPESHDAFRYTLVMENLTVNNVDKLVLIDSLAQVGDHSVFSSEELRYSDFWIRLADDPNIVVTVGDQTLDPDAYTLEYSDKTEFTEEDWDGTSAWSAAPDEHTRSFRIVIGDETASVIGPGQEFRVSFNGQILMKRDNANVEDPFFGQTAWNGFGIHFHMVGDDAYMDASPLNVGVRVPGVPVLQSKIINQSGDQIPADHDVPSRFLIYSGTEISGLANAKTEAEMQALLYENDRVCTYAERTVASGQTQSEELYLTDYRVCAYNDGSGKWEETQTPWIWNETEEYTVLELSALQTEGPEYDQYIFWTLGGVPRNSYTFVYTRSLSQKIAAVDIRKEWNLQINKTDGGTTLPLPGAWFAIYSPVESDALKGSIPDALTQTPSDTLTYEGRTYYLKDIRQSGDDGTILWSGLTKGAYLIVELQAPVYYYVDSTIYFVSSYDTSLGGTEFLDVMNLTGFELPKSGGIGTSVFYMMGCLLTAGAALLFVFRKRVGVKR